MGLTLRIESQTSLPDGGPLSVSIQGKRGIDIGRDQYLDWTLPDPSRFISGKHCEVRWHDGGYWLHDISTNGTFLDGADSRLKEPHKLRNGDRFAVGHYIIAATIDGEGADAGLETPPPMRHQATKNYGIQSAKWRRRSTASSSKPPAISSRSVRIFSIGRSMYRTPIPRRRHLRRHPGRLKRVADRHHGTPHARLQPTTGHKVRPSRRHPSLKSFRCRARVARGYHPSLMVRGPDHRRRPRCRPPLRLPRRACWPPLRRSPQLRPVHRFRLPLHLTIAVPKHRGAMRRAGRPPPVLTDRRSGSRRHGGFRPPVRSRRRPSGRHLRGARSGRARRATRPIDASGRREREAAPRSAPAGQAPRPQLEPDHDPGAEQHPLKFAPTTEDALRIMFGPQTRSYLDAAAP